jgi:periplasmic protein TonB
MVQLDQLLEQRQRVGGRPLRRGALVASILIHTALVASVLVGPTLFAQKPRPLEYVEVVTLPAAALGPGRQPEPQARPEPPRPEPERPPPEPAPKPPPEDAPVLRSEAPVERRPEPPAPTPAARQESQLPPASTGTVEDTAVASFDDPTFTYGYYLDRMAAMISQRWAPPRAPAGMAVVVRFRILTDGTVEQLQLETSSGMRSFDVSGLRAVEQASPLPPLPRGYRKPSLGVALVMRARSE